MTRVQTSFQKHGCAPKIGLLEAEYLLKSGNLNGQKLENDALYDITTRLVGQVRPSREDQYEKRWEDFYLPLKKGSRLIAAPFSITEYQKEFYAFFHRWGALHIKKGNEKIENAYKDVIKDTLGFLPLIKKTNGKILEATVPYSFRTGTIQGKYVLEKTLPAEEKEKLMNEYECRLGKQMDSTGCSLNDYINTAALCYRAAFKNTAGLDPWQMHKKWADTRDGGMLSIKDRDSKSEFSRWYQSSQWQGCHPFEIVFSWMEHGIHLYPPTADTSWKYSLTVTDRGYTGVFIVMAQTLIKNNISFVAENFKEILDYLRGESCFSVNDYGNDHIDYDHSREDRNKYFKHIAWDRLKIAGL